MSDEFVDNEPNEPDDPELDAMLEQLDSQQFHPGDLDPENDPPADSGETQQATDSGVEDKPDAEPQPAETATPDQLLQASASDAPKDTEYDHSVEEYEGDAPKPENWRALSNSRREILGELKAERAQRAALEERLTRLEAGQQQQAQQPAAAPQFDEIDVFSALAQAENGEHDAASADKIRNAAASAIDRMDVNGLLKARDAIALGKYGEQSDYIRQRIDSALAVANVRETQAKEAELQQQEQERQNNDVQNESWGRVVNRYPEMGNAQSPTFLAAKQLLPKYIGVVDGQGNVVQQGKYPDLRGNPRCLEILMPEIMAELQQQGIQPAVSPVAPTQQAGQPHPQNGELSTDERAELERLRQQRAAARTPGTSDTRTSSVQAAAEVDPEIAELERALAGQQVRVM